MALGGRPEPASVEKAFYLRNVHAQNQAHAGATKNTHGMSYLKVPLAKMSGAKCGPNPQNGNKPVVTKVDSGKKKKKKVDSEPKLNLQIFIRSESFLLHCLSARIN